MSSYQITTLQELPSIAQKIIAKAGSKRILLLNGPMGAGKTTLSKEICKTLGSKDDVTSPTYSIVNEYHSKVGTIYHFDFHRIENEEEASDLGAEAYFDSGNYCLVEWPDIVSNLLPSGDEIFPIRIENMENRRIFTF